LRSGRAPVVVFGVLVAATFAAFFVAQRLKNTPSVIQDLSFETGGAGRVFSPNGDGRRERVRAGLMLKKADRVTMTWVNSEGDPVRTIVNDRELPAYKRLWGVRWDGRDDNGKEVPDGRYKLRITLRNQGRTVIYPTSILKDTTPPHPRVLSIGPRREYGPELLPEPDGRPAQIHFLPAQYKARIMIFKTSPGAPRLVRTFAQVARGAKEQDFNGENDAGRRVSPGTYLVVLQWRDPAGNIGTSAPLNAAGLPVLPQNGKRLPGHGGITVRYLAAQTPVTPVSARDTVDIKVDARQARYQWDVRALGTSSVRAHSTNGKTTPNVRFQAPGGKSRVYVFTAHTASRSTHVVFPVQARQSVAGTTDRPKGVLVVLPYVTWQGRNPVDDDGDGAPNTLDAGGPVRAVRVMAGDGLPAGFTEQEGQMLSWLDHQGKRYDITTDLALQLGLGPKLAGHHGVLIPGDARWLPTKVRAQLRAFVRDGGTVLSTGTDSLRRAVTFDPAKGGRLVRPTAEKPTDLFGAKIAPLVSKATNLTIFTQDPKLDLFKGGTGLFPDVESWEATDRVGAEADLLSNAVTEKYDAKWVVVAARFEKGLVLRPGFPSFARRAATNADPATSALMARMWTLLSH
jgi:hypothetical protein